MKRSLRWCLAVWMMAAPHRRAAGAPGDLSPLSADAFGSTGSSIYVAIPDMNDNVLAAGWFETLSGAPRLNLARFHGNSGTMDGLFTPSTGGTQSGVRSVAVLPDGRLLIAGEFGSVNGLPRGRAAILNADGSVLAGFDPALNEYVFCTAVQPDGKLLIGGNFTSAFGVTRNRIVRINADRTLDTGFSPSVNNTVRVMLEQPDGKLIIGGNFTSISGTARNRLARLNPNGSVDATFNPDLDGPVYTAATLKDGKLLVGGSFATVGGTARQNLARLHADGRVDTAFTTGADGIVRALAVQVDGRVIVGGEFLTIGGFARRRFARLEADGAVTPDFTLGANGTVFSAALSQQGGVLLGGSFSRIGSISRVNFARLTNEGSTWQALELPSPGRITWTRLGVVPEARYVTFDYSESANGPWTSLGTVPRTASGWEKTGLSLPRTGHIRAQARIYAGYSGGSSYVRQSMLNYEFDRLRYWRHVHFAAESAEGIAANDADPDRDGLSNAVEYAFALDPLRPDAELLPDWQSDPGLWKMQFTVPESAAGAVYFAEWSDSLQGGWRQIPNTGTETERLYVLPQSAGSRMFVRMRVVIP